MRINCPPLLPCFVVCLSALVWCVTPASAQDVQARTLVTNLEHPSGLAIHPGTGHVFIASRFGVYRYEPKTIKVSLEIENTQDTATDVYGKGPKYAIGPLGLAFMDDDHLVVGDGSRKDGDEFVRIYKIGAKSRIKALRDDAALYTLGPIKKGEQSIRGEGNFYGVAVGAGSIFVTCNGDDTKGWIAKADLNEGSRPSALTPYLSTKLATNVDAPVPIIFSPDGKDLIVGQMGEMTLPGDSLLSVYDPKTKDLKKNFKTGLSDLAGLAYSPKTGKLYGTDFSWSDTSKGGLFELVIEGDAVKTKKMMSLDKPTALAFDKEGRLYLTTFGTAKPIDTAKPTDTAKKGGDSESSPGTLQVIEAGL